MLDLPLLFELLADENMYRLNSDVCQNRKKLDGKGESLCRKLKNKLETKIAIKRLKSIIFITLLFFSIRLSFFYIIYVLLGT